MLYSAYETYASYSDPIRKFSGMANNISSIWLNNPTASPIRRLAAHYEQLELMGFTHIRPDFKIEEVTTSLGERYKVVEELVTSTHFCELVRFKKIGAINQPKILLVAPMSGHFATLLAGTVKTLLQDHEVYITDWLNIRDVPLSSGDFNLDSYVSHIIQFLK